MRTVNSSSSLFWKLAHQDQLHLADTQVAVFDRQAFGSAGEDFLAKMIGHVREQVIGWDRCRIANLLNLVEAKEYLPGTLLHHFFVPDLVGLDEEIQEPIDARRLGLDLFFEPRPAGPSVPAVSW